MCWMICFNGYLFYRALFRSFFSGREAEGFGKLTSIVEGDGEVVGQEVSVGEGAMDVEMNEMSSSSSVMASEKEEDFDEIQLDMEDDERKQKQKQKQEEDDDIQPQQDDDDERPP
eukprot:CAMPEP_0201517636 /NCGR_PEP_ID=MMETSP0161_2-20130828/8698_1 /ASSEMBLY_ACC=CAM_ASM_000251 /TAXON_ID=180227 /ORGANISM="Neoparamoeba aestuarina, Strain SoJaBio B1-5/56/2" /LENGTH=114 /DNA_ID=CAMNT_0047915191 /DNA_START=134 /DNA_END=475 /DNA_ORIENTATION=+